MGQKQSGKIRSDRLEVRIERESTASSTSSSSSSSPSYNYDSSAIYSHDSGCYVANDSCSRNTNNNRRSSDCSFLSHSKHDTKHISSKLTETHLTSDESVLVAGSFTDSSSLTNISQSLDTSEDVCRKKAQLLCDQLNQILSLSTNLLHGNDRIDQCSTTKGRTFAKRQANKKILNRSHTFHSNYQNESVVKNLRPDFSFIGRSKNNTIELKPVDELSDDYSCRVDNDNYDDDDYDIQRKKYSTRKISDYLVRGSRRLLGWNHKKLAGTNQISTLDKIDFTTINEICEANDNKQSLEGGQYNRNSSNLNKTRVHEQTVNLIAAKLLSENIDLARLPYTDEFGFCKIPFALVKRYSSELRQPIQIVSKCLEAERLNQLTKLGKIGIPNDFLFKKCQCKSDNTSLESDNFQWQSCKCDIDTSNVEAFFIRLGFPMYLEPLRTKHLLNGSLSVFFEIDQSELQTVCSIQNKTHLTILMSALHKAKSFF